MKVRLQGFTVGIASKAEEIVETKRRNTKKDKSSMKKGLKVPYSNADGCFSLQNWKLMIS